MAMALRAEARDIKEGLGDYWWLSVLKAFTKSKSDEKVHWY
jgi:hypothetical protein